jgi:dipeptidyl aminopeptidase/acylaminoacyl peptidase
MNSARAIVVIGLICGARSNALAAAHTPISLRELVEVSEPAQLSISPNGKLVGFMVATPSLEFDETRTEVVVVDVDTAQVVQVIPNGPLIRSWTNWLEVEAPAWSADSRCVYVRALEGGEIQVWRIDVTTGERARVTSDDADVEKLSVGNGGRTLSYWIRDSRQEVRRKEELAAGSGYLADDGLMLYQDLPHNYWFEGRRVTMTLHADTIADGTLLDVAGSPLRRNEMDLSTRITTPRGVTVSDPNPVWKTEGIKVFHDNGHGEVAVARELPNVAGQFDFEKLQIVGAADGAMLSECGSPECTGVIQSVQWTADDRRVVFIKNDGSGAQRIIEEWNPTSGKVRRITSIAGILVGGQPYRLSGKEGECPITGHSMVCEYEDSTIAPRVIRVDLSKGRVTTLFDPNPAITADRLGRVETRTWQDGLGNHLFSKLVFPPEYDPVVRYPLVISTYMCNGFLRGGSGEEFPEFLFAAAGMLSVCVNYGGAQPRHPDSISEMAQVPPLERARILYETIIYDLDRRGLIDTHHIGIGGFSWSSKVVEWELFHSTRFAAASIAAPSLPDPIWADWMSVNRWDQVRPLYGLPASDDPADPAWQLISPALNARKIKTPLMINAAESETRSGIQLYAALRRQKVPLELYVYPEEDHQIFAYPSHRAIIYQRNVDWFRFWLQAIEDTAVAKAEQYARWRRMREDSTHPGLQHNRLTHFGHVAHVTSDMGARHLSTT